MTDPQQPDQGRSTEPMAARAAETTQNNPWPVSLFSDKLKAHIERVGSTWVEGQLVEFSLRNGNAWMTLRDLDQEISFSAVAWRSAAANLPTDQLVAGSRVVAQVKPNLWQKSGRLSLITENMKPVGIGDLLARIEKLRQSLNIEGLFDPAYKKDLPVLPRRIGLITGRESDAKKDILRNVQLRWPAAQFLIKEVATQGTAAPREVKEALEELDEHDDVDVIVIARGGGALEEVILPFSDESLLRAVFAAMTPVVSAIGHEADRPLLDEVADARASTPTAAAKLVVVDAAHELQQISAARTRMVDGLQRRLVRETQWLEQIRSRQVLAQPEKHLIDLSQQVHQLRRRALFATQSTLDRAQDWVRSTRAHITAVSPQATLDRGYAVVEHQGKILRETAQLASESTVSVLLGRGSFTAEVRDIRPAVDDNDGD